MSQLEHAVRHARFRLRVNHFSALLVSLLSAATVLFAAVVWLNRLYDVRLPIGWIGAGLALLSVSIALALVHLRPLPPVLAAALLDQAADLRERLSSAWYCRSVPDPFAQAVVAGAESVSAALHVGQFVRLKAPPRWGMPILGLLAASGALLVSPGILKSEAAKLADQQADQRNSTRLAVQKRLEPVKELTETGPLEELKSELEQLEALAGVNFEKPGQIRHEAVKRLDKLEDVIRAKRSSDEYEAVPQLQKMLRALPNPQSSEAPTDKLAKALRDGDFKTAKEEIQAIKDQLATLKSESDREMVEKMGKQLDQLARQLEQLAQNQNLAKQPAQAGVKQEDIERMLERLSKQDLDGLKKQLEKSGLSKEQADKLAKQLQSRQQAGQKGQQLAQALKQAAQGLNSGSQSGEAQAGLSSAGEQLSELEMLEQEMNQLESAMAAVLGAKQDIDKPCPS